MKLSKEEFARVAADVLSWPQKDFDTLVRLRQERVFRLKPQRKGKVVEYPTKEV